MSNPVPTPLNQCQSCGATIYPKSNYCHNCGASVSTNSVAADLIDRVTEFYPTYMVTLVSIIQAAALGYLLLAVQDQLRAIAAGTYDPLWTILIVSMFIMIVATWVNYTRGVIVTRLVPSTLDSVIPFFFGVSQALVVFSIILQQVAWFYFAFTLNALVGLSQFVSILRETRRHKDRVENRLFLARTEPAFQSTIRIAALRSVIFFSFGVIEAVLKLQSVVLALILLAMNIYMIYVVHKTTSLALGE